MKWTRLTTPFFVAALCLNLPAIGSAYAADATLQQAIADTGRTPKFVARDAVRHPLEELTFFGIKPDQTVVEISPGGGYWTEILAPYLRDHGELYTAIDTPGESAEGDMLDARFTQKLKSDPDRYGKVIVTTFGTQGGEVAPAGSADLVVTFRNLHNWMNAGYADKAFASFYNALKPGGILGIEEHRARPDKPQDPKAASGYVREDYTIALAKKAGFILVGSSEINANPKDTTDWPRGVWTLPPALALGDTDRAKYEAIGEADNFVLKFRKP